MADVQINDLPIASSFDGTENLPLQNTSDETKRGLLSSLGSFFAKVLSFSADLKTTNDTLVGAINELNDCANIADEYDSSHTYNTGNRVIYEGVLYVCNDDNVTGDWDSTKWDSATIDEIISALTAADIPYSAGVSVADKLDNVPTFDTLTTGDNNKLLGVSVSGDDISVEAVNISSVKSSMLLANFAVYSAERILNDTTKSIPLTQNLFVLFFKSYANADCYGAYLISYHSSVQSSQYISILAQGSSFMPTLSISGSNLVIATSTTDIYYSMLRLN